MFSFLLFRTKKVRKSEFSDIPNHGKRLDLSCMGDGKGSSLSCVSQTISTSVTVSSNVAIYDRGYPYSPHNAGEYFLHYYHLICAI